MKHKPFSPLFALLFAVILLQTCTGKIDRAISYNDIIVDAYQALTDNEAELLYSILSYDTLTLDTNYNLFIEQIQLSREKVKSLGSFEDEYDAFYKATLEVFSIYEKVAKNEILEIIAFMPKFYEDPDCEILNEELENMLIELDEIFDDAFIFFETAQQKFAARYSFPLG